MKLGIQKNKYTFTASPSDTFSDILRFLCRQDIRDFPETVTVRNASVPKERIEDMLLAIHQVTSFRETQSYFPEDVDDSSNFMVSYKDWSDVPCYQRYVNHRMKIISDPEYLVIYWSKSFESFDVNNSALLPSYPKSMTNMWFTPQEIKQVCRLILLEWTVNGRRTKEIPMTHKSALNQFKESFPLLYDLVFTPDGNTVLETVYAIILLTDKDYRQSKETRKKCIALFRSMLDNIKTKSLQTYMKKNDKIGVHFVGMPNAKIIGSCLLTMYFSFSYFYFSSDNIYHLDAPILNYIQKIKEIYRKKYPNGIYEVDYDIAIKKNITKPVFFDFFRKDYIDKINIQLKRPNNSKFFKTLTPILLCMMNSDDASLKA